MESDLVSLADQPVDHECESGDDQEPAEPHPDRCPPDTVCEPPADGARWHSAQGETPTPPANRYVRAPNASKGSGS